MRKTNWQCYYTSPCQLLSINQHKGILSVNKTGLRVTSFGSFISYGLVILSNEDDDFEHLLSELSTSFIY